ncbi:sodium-coupled monocarboxylate transporter 1-like [Glandiceps talaboti]
MASNDVIAFGVVDYVVFSGMLVISTLTGIYHGFAKGGQHSTSRCTAITDWKNTILADKSMHFLPVAMSILVSFTSPLSIMGTPAEIYVHGIRYAVFSLSLLWCLPMVAYLYLPVFQNLQLTSAYEYMEMRFNFPLRILVAIIFIIQSAFYMAACLVGPAIAIEAVQNFDFWKTIVLTGLLCTLYTAFGGMKGVIWTDVFQFFIIIGTLLAVIVMAAVKVGGFTEVFEANNENGRLDIFGFELDPTVRLTFFNSFIGGAITMSPMYVSQTAVQRYMTIRSLKKSQASVLINIPFTLVTLPCMYFTGLALYAFYNNGMSHLQPAINSTFSPELQTMISSVQGADVNHEPNYSSADQIVVYFVSSQFGKIPGLQGLFVSCLFAGTLSSVSSSLNSMTAVTLEDFIKQYRKWQASRTGKPIYQNDRMDTFVSKLLTCVYGICGVGLSFVAVNLGSLIVLGNSILGVTGGPILAAFTVGVLYKRANGIGMLIGTLLGFGVGFWIAAGAFASNNIPTDDIVGLYKVSYMMYGFYATVVTIVIGIVVSEIVRLFVREERMKYVDPILLATFMRPSGWTKADSTLVKAGDEGELEKN